MSAETSEGEILSKEDLEEWSNYKIEYEKQYTDEEDVKRRKLYFETKKRVEEHNKKFDEGLVTFTVGINQFADKLRHEICGCMRKRDMKKCTETNEEEHLVPD